MLNQSHFSAKPANLIRLVLALFLAAVLALSVMPFASAEANEPTADGDAGFGQVSDFDQMLEKLRQEFFGENVRARGFEPDLTPVYVDDSRILHQPPDYRIPPDFGAPSGGGDDFGVMSAGAQSYVEGSTRNFHAMIIGNNYKSVMGVLVKQSDNVNIWVLDKADYISKMGGYYSTTQCTLDEVRYDTALLDDIANWFDQIFNRMTSDFGAFKGVNVITGNSIIPAVGDVDMDGRVNILLYNTRGKTGSEQSYLAGFFTNGDFFNDLGNTPIAMIHIDIARSFGYTLATGDADYKLQFYSVLAHELQHLLFYMYFGVYFPDDGYETYQSFLWFNESLSELARAFYTQYGTEVITQTSMRSACENSYANSDYGDFIHFNNSFKNYGMSKLHSVLMHRKTGGSYVTDVYSYFKEFLPIATNAEMFYSNMSKIDAPYLAPTRMVEIVGDTFHSAGMTGSATSDDAFALLYFLFMENFAADGGYVHSNSGLIPVKTRKFNTSTLREYNLWGIRPEIADITSFGTNSNISLQGYSGQGYIFATHEKMHSLNGESAATPVLKISVNDSDIDTRYYDTQYYVVVPIDEPNTSYLGQFGANVYPLKKNNIVNYINTEGRPAYLFAATFRRNVNAQVVYSWQSNMIKPGDLDENGVVNAADLSILLANFGKSGAAITNPAADIDGNNVVNAADLSILLANFGK